MVECSAGGKRAGGVAKMGWWKKRLRCVREGLGRIGKKFGMNGQRVGWIGRVLGCVMRFRINRGERDEVLEVANDSVLERGEEREGCSPWKRLHKRESAVIWETGGMGGCCDPLEKQRENVEKKKEYNHW